MTTPTTITIALASDSELTIQHAYDAISGAYPDAEIDVTRATVDATSVRVYSETESESALTDCVRDLLDRAWQAAVEAD